MTVPSRNIITEFFLSDFFSKEQHYINQLQSTYCESALSIDHTFKIAAHVGYFRSDGVWVSQYDSLFIVLNEIGEVTSWMFTAFDEVRPLLKDINKRMVIYSADVKHLYIDNCYMWRDCLQSVFGVDVCVQSKELQEHSQNVMKITTLVLVNLSWYSVMLVTLDMSAVTLDMSARYLLLLLRY